jgi:hypothetical protein
MDHREWGSKRHAVRKDDPDSPLYFADNATDWAEVRRKPKPALECPERCGVELVPVEDLTHRYVPRFFRIKSTHASARCVCAPGARAPRVASPGAPTSPALSSVVGPRAQVKALTFSPAGRVAAPETRPSCRCPLRLTRPEPLRPASPDPLCSPRRAVVQGVSRVGRQCRKLSSLSAVQAL